ncbi:hypothetical protein ACGC1H_003183 [Rhizoctonia solani]
MAPSPTSSPHLPNSQCEELGFEWHLSASSIRPIKQLPDELLLCIFNYVFRTEPRPSGSSFRSHAEWCNSMRYPILLSHICSNWRQIAICSATLWCRICIYPELFNHPGCVALLEAYLNRAGQSLLDIFILTSPHPGYPDTSVDCCVSDEFLTFLQTAVPRAKYLILKSERGLFSGEHPRRTLITCLDKCAPGTLAEITVDVATDDYPVSQSLDMSLDLPRHKLEKLWQSVPVLRLNGYYPYAINTSDLGANQGLTELRLKGCHPITETTLIGILTASPRLRVLEVSMDIIGSLSKGSLIEPIHIETLEVVKSGIMNRPLTHQRQLRILLRLLQPGSKQLSLCISNPNHNSSTEFVCQPEVRAFLARSNVRQLCVYDLESRSHLVELLKLIPSVRVLALSALKSLEPDVNKVPTRPSLDALYVIPSFLSLPPGVFLPPSSDWSTVEWLAETYKFPELTVWLQDFNFGYSPCLHSQELLIPENFYSICPVVNVMSRETPNPAQEWC